MQISSEWIKYIVSGGGTVATTDIESPQTREHLNKYQIITINGVPSDYSEN